MVGAGVVVGARVVVGAGVVGVVGAGVVEEGPLHTPTNIEFCGFEQVLK